MAKSKSCRLFSYIAMAATISIAGCATTSGPDRAPAAAGPEKSFGESYEDWSNRAKVCVENALVGTFGLALGHFDLFTQPHALKVNPSISPQFNHELRASKNLPDARIIKNARTGATGFGRTDIRFTTTRGLICHIIFCLPPTKAYIP